MARMGSSLARLKQLDEERAKLLKHAKADALAKVHAALAELNSFGFSYRITEGKIGARGVATGARPRKKKRAMKDEPCPICGFKTKPLHDRRAHRGQDTKRPFTAAELAEKGMQKA